MKINKALYFISLFSIAISIYFINDGISRYIIGLSFMYVVYYIYKLVSNIYNLINDLIDYINNVDELAEPAKYDKNDLYSKGNNINNESFHIMMKLEKIKQLF